MERFAHLAAEVRALAEGQPFRQWSTTLREAADAMEWMLNHTAAENLRDEVRRLGT
jgi:hypothetical protein